VALLRDARPLMGTVFSVAAPDDAAPDDAAADGSTSGNTAADGVAETFRRAWGEALALLQRIEEIYSPFIAESPVSRIRAGVLRLEDLDAQPDLTADEIADFREVLGLCAQLRRESGGAFDAWSVGAPPAFDPSGAVKGWAAERASALLAARGLPTHLLNAGGDVRLRGTGEFTWNVGVEDPHRPDRMLVTLALADGAVATSGTRQRGSHVWDPLARREARGLTQVTIVGPDLALADGYATAALALDARARAFLTDLGARGPYQGFTVDDAQGVWWSEGFEQYAPVLRGLLRPDAL
jgi:thiamine biosynthesis lipoprotein